MQKCTIAVCLAVAVALLVLSIVAACLVDLLVERLALKQTLLTPGTPAYQQWLATSFPMHLQFYFFNLKNPREFQNGAKPEVQQQGPYTYREQRLKKFVFINNSAGVITYKEVKRYFFEDKLSVGLESDKVMGVNLGYLAISNMINHLPPSVVSLISFLLHLFNYGLCVTHSVGEILWGYQDPILASLKAIDVVTSDRIGLYLDKNDTDDGLITIDSGANNSADLGHILQYHGFPTLSCWTTSEANMINGSDGSLFRNSLQPHEQVDVFSSDICRSIRFNPVSQEFIEGIPVRKFLPLEDTFDSALNNPRNEGFCINKSDCLKDGLLDMSTCIPDAPIAVSLPHLTHADPSYQAGVVGLRPSEEFNTTFFIQPILGAVISASKKIQLNAVVKQNKQVLDLANVNDVFLPIVFLNESVLVDPATAGRLRLLLATVPFAVKLAGSIVAVLLFVTIVSLAFVYYRVHRSQPKPLLNDQDADLLVPPVIT